MRKYRKQILQNAVFSLSAHCHKADLNAKAQHKVYIADVNRKLIPMSHFNQSQGRQTSPSG